MDARRNDEIGHPSTDEKILSSAQSSAMSLKDSSIPSIAKENGEPYQNPTGSSFNSEIWQDKRDETQRELTVKDLEEEYEINNIKLNRKVDMRLLPPLCILYLMAFLDRVNISNAVLFGMESDLNLKGHQYNSALTIFFVPYILFEVPSNYFLKKFKPSRYLPTTMALFGMVVVFQGLTKNFSGLLATRFFLGLFEAGMFPGCFYLLAMFYRREEAQKRYSFFFASTTLAGAFAGLLASAIGKMEGLCGMNGWRWIFIIEGCATFLIAVFAYFFIVDFPEEAKFLTPQERKFLRAKLELDVGKSLADKPMTLKSVGNVFKDIKVWLSAFMYFGLVIPSYGYAYFAPTILKQFKYGTIQTQLHSVPPWAAAFGLCNLSAYFSDKLMHRYLFSMFCSCVALVGFGMLLGIHDNAHAEYAGLFLIVSGLFSSMPIIVCWTNTNFSGHIRRAVSTGFQVGFGNIGGIISTFSFLSTQAPRYIPGYSIGIAFTVFSMIASTAYAFVVHWENKQRIQGKRQAAFDALSPEEQAEAGDLNPSYRYNL